MSVKVLHTADFHLGSPFETLAPDKASERTEGQYALLEKIISLAEQYAVEAILIGGDLFDRPTVSPDIATRVSKIFSETDIPIFIAPGNHDYFHTRSPYNLISWPGNVHIFKSHAIERVELDNLVVYGAGFTGPCVFDPLLGGFSTMSSMTGGLDHKPSVMVLHGELNPPEPRYNPVYASDIAASGLDYLALGHIHARTDPLQAGRTVYACCGCPEGRGFDETGQKGCYLVEFGERIKVRFVPAGGIRYEVLTIDLTGCSDPASRIIGALPGDPSSSVLRIVLRGEIPPEMLRIDEIAERLSSHVYHAVLSDRTSLPENMWEKTGDDDLCGLFLSILKEKLTDGPADDEAAELIGLAARYGLAALNGEEVPQL